jgi:hypothetical protein
MKTMMRLYPIKVALAVLCSAMSCQVQEDTPVTSSQDRSKGARLSAETGVIDVNLEAVTTTRSQVLAAGTEKRNPALDAIYGAPSQTHSTVHLKVLADGSVESEILFDESVQNEWVKHKSLPDPSPRMAKAVIKGGQLYLYNTAGELTSTRPVPIQNMKPMLDEMQAAKNKVRASKTFMAKAAGLPGLDVETMLEQAKAKNAQVKDLSSSVKEVVLDTEQPSRGDSRGPSSFRMTYRLDVKRNVMLGGELVDRKTGKLLSRTVMHYRHRPETNDDMVSQVYTEDYRENAKTGRREKTITTCQYKKFEFINNL